MEYTRYAEPGAYDDVAVRGDLAAREFVAFWLSEGRVLAGMNVHRLADPGDPLTELLSR